MIILMINSLTSATKLKAHLENLASFPASFTRSMVVVCDVDFTNIELAPELSKVYITFHTLELYWLKIQRKLDRSSLRIGYR